MTMTKKLTANKTIEPRAAAAAHHRWRLFSAAIIRKTKHAFYTFDYVLLRANDLADRFASFLSCSVYSLCILVRSCWFYDCEHFYCLEPFRLIVLKTHTATQDPRALTAFNIGFLWRCQAIFYYFYCYYAVCIVRNACAGGLS